jgi:predicted ATP-dependent protease
VTGSVNQRGEIQAIGAVNEKIEGFFEVCKAKGLTGSQGVIIPKKNTQNLMVNPKVVEAVKQGKFHIYPVSTIDQGIEILTGWKAGELDEDRTFEEGTLNDCVDRELQRLASSWKAFAAKGIEGEQKESLE